MFSSLRRRSYPGLSPQSAHLRRSLEVQGLDHLFSGPASRRDIRDLVPENPPAIEREDQEDVQCFHQSGRHREIIDRDHLLGVVLQEGVPTRNSIGLA